MSSIKCSLENKIDEEIISQEIYETESKSSKRLTLYGIIALTTGTLAYLTGLYYAYQNSINFISP